MNLYSFYSDMSLTPSLRDSVIYQGVTPKIQSSMNNPITSGMRQDVIGHRSDTAGLPADSKSHDVLYYSNYCEHSKTVLQFISRHGLIEHMSCISVDKRVQDPVTYQLYIITEKGRQIPLPPIIHNVPSILCVKKHCTIINGKNDCLRYLGSTFQIPMENEFHPPSIGGPRPIHSFEPLSSYNSENIQFVSANSSSISIPTPPETYQPDTIGLNVSIDSLQEKRMNEHL